MKHLPSRIKVDFWPGVRLRRRWRRVVARAPFSVKLLVGVALTVTLTLTVNWIYQVIRKPSELLFPVSGTLYKTPAATWASYAPIFNTYATRVITADFLAAMAQVEGSGNPVARTYWRWSWTLHPFAVYRPASSAVGMYQITDGTFAEARRYCIRNHAVAADGRWDDWHSCWFNSLYARVIPANAVELTSADLDRNVAVILDRHRLNAVPLDRKQALAAVIHLCGAHTGDTYAQRGFRLLAGQRCGDQRVGDYLVRIESMRLTFTRLAAGITSATSGTVDAATALYRRLD